MPGSLHFLPPMPGRSGESRAVVPGAPRVCSYLNHNQKTDGEEEEEEALHLWGILVTLLVAAFRDEHGVVFRLLGLVAFEPGGRGGGVEAGRRRAQGWGAASFLQTLGLSTPGPRF